MKGEVENPKTLIFSPGTGLGPLLNFNQKNLGTPKIFWQNDDDLGHSRHDQRRSPEWNHGRQDNPQEPCGTLHAFRMTVVER